MYLVNPLKRAVSVQLQDFIEMDFVTMVCIQVTQSFLDYSKRVGNDLSTPMPEYNFQGLKEGDSWCLAIGNFIKSIEDGFAPKIFLNATHQAVLEIIDLEILKQYALDKEKL